MCEIFEHLKLTKTSEVQKLRRNVAQDNRATRVETAESEQDEVLMQCLSIVRMTESLKANLSHITCCACLSSVGCSDKREDLRGISRLPQLSRSAS